MAESSEQLATLQDLQGIPLDQLSSAVSSALDSKQRELDAHYYQAAPAFLALHSEVQSSLTLLSSLSTFLSSFQRDLSHVSGHISDLQDRSHALDQRLQGRRQLDRLLSQLIAQVTLSPRLVDLFFDSEPKQGGWLEACEDLERVLDSTRSVAASVQASAAAAGDGSSTPVSATFAPATTSATAAAAAAAAAASDPNLPMESKILIESRTLATACLGIAVRKLRPYLLSYFHPFKTSISTNLQVLQTSVLLKAEHRNLYAFLARQAPRVAIDVQRGYLAAARLYYETGFRRYVRALERIRARGSSSSSSAPTVVGGTGSGPGSASGSGANTPGGGAGAGGAGSGTSDTLIAETSPSTMSAAALALLSRAGGGGGSAAEKLDAEDTLFLLDDNRLAQSRFDGPGVILAYMADNPVFRAPPEALFRSIALTFLDNACSEYTFLVRYFESLPAPRHQSGSASGSSSNARRPVYTSSQSALRTPRTSMAPSTRPSFDLRSPPATGGGGGGGGPEADESASVADGGADPRSAVTGTSAGGGFRLEEIAEDDDFGGSLVRLTIKEQRARKGRGAEDELWRQVMEPVLGHWTTFTKALLSSTPQSPSLLSLLSMVKLNESLLAAATARGCAAVLQGPLLTFKIEAWPLIQRSFDEHIASLRRLMQNYGISTAGRPNVSGMSASSGAAAAVAGLTSWSGLTGLVNAAANATSTYSPAEKFSTIRLICTRYGRLFISIVQLSEEQNETMLFGSVARLRDEVQHLIAEGSKVIAAKAGAAAAGAGSAEERKRSLYQAVHKALMQGADGVAAGANQSRIQSELALWSNVA